MIVFCRDFIGAWTDFVVIFIGVPALGVSFLILLGYTFRHTSVSKLKHAGLAVFLAVTFLVLTSQIASLGKRAFFLTRKEALNEFVRDILAYGRIRSMSDGLRYFKDLNGELVVYTAAEVDPIVRDPHVRRRRLVSEILFRDGIDPTKYEEFRLRLQRLKFIQFEVQPGYVAFLYYGGFFKDGDGYLVTRGGANPPTIKGTALFDLYRLYYLQGLGNGWYWFGCS